MSWSSKIIAVGTVAYSQRTSGSPQDSPYSSAYSAKFATCRPGGSDTSRRRRITSWVIGEVSSAYTWSPSSSRPSGHSSSGAVASARAYASSASVPYRPSLITDSGEAYRQEPNASRTAPPGRGVRIRGGGYDESAGGQTFSPSSRTS